MDNVTPITITGGDLIKAILNANKFEDILSVDGFKFAFNLIAKEIHPDKCSLPGAAEAMSRMGEWKEYYENGKQYKDDAGTFRTNGYWVEFASTQKNLEWSFENYQIFKALKDPSSIHFQKYLPDSEGLLDGKQRLNFNKRAIPLSGLTLPQEHVNWVLNRLLEYCAYLSEIGFSHCGLNPESVFIIPENHGIQIVSFYHLTKFGNRIGTISGKYKNWYPQDTFVSKTANPLIDMECAKKIACYLLGEPSGNAIKLRKTHNEDFINFLVTQHDNAYKALTIYRDLLKKNFKKEFHSLTI